MDGLNAAFGPSQDVSKSNRMKILFTYVGLRVSSHLLLQIPINRAPEPMNSP